MNKDKEIIINFKLINLLIFIFSIFIIYNLKDTFTTTLYKLYDIFLILLFSFLLSYIIYPTYNKLNKYINKYLAVFIIYLILIVSVFLIIYFTIPSYKIIEDLSELTNNIRIFLSNTSEKYNINFNNIIDEVFNALLSKIVYFISNIISFIVDFILVITLSIYILINIDNIKKYIKNKFNNYSNILLEINSNIYNYFYALSRIVIIQFCEYTIIYYLIGHPNFLLLGFLNGITSFIPVFGAIFSNAIALITASIIDRKLFILTSFIILIIPNIDTYVINPRIYKNINKLSPIISILSTFIFGMLFGIIGIIFSIPISLTIIVLLKHKQLK